MNIAKFLARFSIKTQILIGFVPVLLVLTFFALTSYHNFETFSKNFDNLSEIREENILFLEIEKDIVELQRNVLVYSYVGYTGVLKKIWHLEEKLEGKFHTAREIAQPDPQINDRLSRMSEHYIDYKSGFREVIQEKTRIQTLKEDVLHPTIDESYIMLDEMIKHLEEEKNYEEIWIATKIKLAFLSVATNSHHFEVSPDASFIRENKQLFKAIEKDIQALVDKLTGHRYSLSRLEKLKNNLDTYQKTFQKMINLNRSYLHLVNIVLAGKAAEIDKLSGELDRLILDKSNSLGQNIQKRIHDSQGDYLILSIFAAVIGILSALIVALGIAQPVTAMASTLSQLAKGKSVIKIPGQNRKDEVGEMAKAANEFKVMAEYLEEQTDELEEFAYRTSHDLRSPLVSSIGVLGVVQDSIKNNDLDEAQTGVQLVEGSLRKLEALVKDILDLTRTKNIKEEDNEIDFEQIVEDSISKMTHMENFDRLTIDKQLDFDGVLKAKKNRVVLIVENLISNAIKYQDTEKNNSFIKIRTYEEGRNIVVSVEDNGIGIPEKGQQKIFDMFQRFHPKISFGSGLGLYMMKKSAQILGGEISYEDTGAGSLFKLTIPMVK